MGTPANMPKDHGYPHPRLTASIGPHIRGGDSVEVIMWTVSAALLPAAAVSVYLFGFPALKVILASVLSAMAFEYMAQRAMGVKPTISDGSGFMTGLLLAMNLPAGVPLYLPVAGTAVAIIVNKQIFGGLGYNIFNPALIGRALLLASWPREMTAWPVPNHEFSLSAVFSRVDATTAATPLAIIKEEGMKAFASGFDSASAMYTRLLLGDTGGSLGEVSAVALLIGAAYLLFKRYITWHIPFTFIGTVALGSWLLGRDPIVSVLSGGLILGAFFMATDYVTVPVLKRGQIVFGIGCGLLTVIIRQYGGYPEGVCYAILLMNCFTPLLDRAFRTRKFGEQIPVREAA